jgi:hypothetical protein
MNATTCCAYGNVQTLPDGGSFRRTYAYIAAGSGGDCPGNRTWRGYAESRALGSCLMSR